MNSPMRSIDRRFGICGISPRRCAAVLGAVFVAVSHAAPLAAQSTGGIVGQVVDATNEHSIRGVDIRLDGMRFTTTTDSAGQYRLRAIPSGMHSLTVLRPGYRPEHRDSIQVISGEVTRVDVRLAPQAVQLADLRAVGVQDPVLDPLATATEQRITADQLRRLPVTNLQDAIAMQAGVVGESFRGGRPGEQAFVLDGFGIKNQLDASTNGSAAIQIPPDLIVSASLITNGYSARYGQAISGVVDVTTMDGGPVWRGRTAYETDRPLAGGADHGIDRIVFQADGPIGKKIRAVGILDLNGQLDGDPSSAPAPSDTLDPRSSTPYPLPHSSTETWTAGGKLTIPFSDRLTGRLFGLATTQQAYLYDPMYKYDPNDGPGSRTNGKLLTAHLQMLPPSQNHTPLWGDLRVGYSDKSFVRGEVAAPDYAFGAFTGKTMHILDEEIAKRQDTISTRAALPDFGTPQFASNTPWGVPAFFQSGAGSGELAWNDFSELRSQLDATLGLGRYVDLAFGGMYAAQSVKTFQRVLSYLPVGDSVPPPTASNFSPWVSGAYVEGQARASDLGFTAGLRYDGFAPGTDLHNATLNARSTLSPRVAVSTQVKGATFVASIGKFSQPPDLQYLVDAAFDDTTRTGRFRQGNPNLGFESATQYEMSARVRLPSGNSLKINIYDKHLDGLVASVPINVNPDSSVFVNADVGTVTGAELIFERELHDGWGVRVSGVVQRAEATVSNAFLIYDQTHINPITGDTVPPSRAQFPLDYDRRLAITAVVTGEISQHSRFSMFGVRPLAGLQMSAVGRYYTGLPYTRTNTAGDSLTGPINGSRLPNQYSIDALFRRPMRVGKFDGSIYLDMRNLLNTQNQTSVRRDTGTPTPDDATVAALAMKAYLANPNPIPYESPRYRAWADKNGDGLLSGQSELLPLYTRAATDFTFPLFVYGPPRLVRFGVELLF
ncbi:MAG TPA: TonB-dependent receptor [Gemmatimonadales bacterium]